MNSKEKTKRTAPVYLRKLLDFDVIMTKQFLKWAHNYVSFRSLQIHYKLLEISCHGIPWLTFWIAFSWLFNAPDLIQLQVNMLLGLMLDIIFVAVIKSYVRRRRPAANTDDKLGQLGPDKFSFPSGHASRATFVLYIFLILYPLPVIFLPPVFAWCASVCLSRILLSRHFIFDVIGGIVLGLFEGKLLEFLWLSDDTCKWLLSMISEENWSGGEYHV